MNVFWTYELLLSFLPCQHLHLQLVFARHEGVSASFPPPKSIVEHSRSLGLVWSRAVTSVKCRKPQTFQEFRKQSIRRCQKVIWHQPSRPSQPSQPNSIHRADTRRFTKRHLPTPDPGDNKLGEIRKEERGKGEEKDDDDGENT